jgi:hypothetical protein
MKVRTSADWYALARDLYIIEWYGLAASYQEVAAQHAARERAERGL